MNLGEIFSNAAMNTLLGMGTVFAVLIFISLIIYLLKYASPRKADQAAAKAAQASEPEPEPEQEIIMEEEAQDVEDYQLIAVITAAMAASLGRSTDGFVVRSIKRAKNSKWRA